MRTMPNTCPYRLECPDYDGNNDCNDSLYQQCHILIQIQTPKTLDQTIDELSLTEAEVQDINMNMHKDPLVKRLLIGGEFDFSRNLFIPNRQNVI